MCEDWQVPDYTDSHGKRLTDYPRPSVAVDTAVLTVADDALSVAVVDTGSGQRLPGTFLHEGETLADAVRRSLADKAGIRGLRPQQLHVFDAVGRDDRGRVLSVAHLVVVPVEALAGVDVVDVAGLRGLAYDHDEILALAVARVRADYAAAPDPARLLGNEFTLLELERLHKTVDPDGTPRRDSFRRRMVRVLEETGGVREGIVGKPARVFRRVE